VLVLALGIAVLATGTAMASGPAAPGKQIVPLICDQPLGTVVVSVPSGENSNGAGQVVDAKGHGIPAAFSFTLTDVSTSTVLDSEGPFGVGGGHAHPNQPTVHCSGVEFDGSAADFFGTQLPPGVSAEDEILATFDVDVILKNV
jgi:hypothetical protein